tara:strand:- start:24 stop:236 length:213 start_codon:yes stop_codon:yes gene_type:complete
MRYKYKINKRNIGFKSLILISFFEKYMNTKHKPSKTILINEKLEPIIIEIGKIENKIIGKLIFLFSVVII